MPRLVLRVGAILIGAGLVWACAANPPPDPIAPPPPVRAPVTAPSPAPPPNSAPAPVPMPSPSNSAANTDVVVTAPPKLPPVSDTRSVAERREDRQAFNRCVIKAQAQIDKAGPGAMMESPEEICFRQLGMRTRNDAPNTR
jgi:hypothetical protein